MNHLQIYTDGAYDWKRKVGGYGAVLLNGKGYKRYVSKSYVKTTHNRMEMRAILSAIDVAPEKLPIDIYSDSKYCITMMKTVKKYVATNKNPAGLGKFENFDLLNVAFIMFLKMKDRKITFNWVRGHSGNPLNELADECAKKAKEKPDPIQDIEFKFLKT